MVKKKEEEIMIIILIIMLIMILTIIILRERGFLKDLMIIIKTINIREEIDTAYQRMYNQCKDIDCFKKIEENCKNFNGILFM
jgi:hypothetical protein